MFRSARRASIRPDRLCPEDRSASIPGDDGFGIDAEPGQEHEHLLGGGVLRLVEDNECVIECAAAHVCQRCDFDNAAFGVFLDFLSPATCRADASCSGRR